MATEKEARPSRRNLMKAAIGGAAAATAATAVGRAAPAAAADGDPVLIGRDNTATGITEISNGFTDAYLADGFNGVVGTSNAANGSGLDGLFMGQSGNGVIGRTIGNGSQVGVKGESAPQGIGVYGYTQNGTGVRAEAVGGGYGLDVHGTAVFSNSGRAAFAKGAASKTVPIGGYLRPASLVLATIQGNVAGTWVQGVSLDRTNNTITIRLNKAAPMFLNVGWFVVN